MTNFEKLVKKKVAELKRHTFFDPTYDANFKRIFSKDSTLIHFLNAILHLEGKRKIKSVKRKKPSVTLSSKIGNEEVRFDVHAQLENGNFIDLEMQRAEHEDFIDRMELYASQLAINSKIDFDQNRPTEDVEDHPYQMPQTYSVWICKFEVDFCKSYREEIGLFRFSDVGSREALPIYDKKKYIIVDLKKYKPTGREPPEALWLEVFTKMASASKAPKTRDKEIANVYRTMLVKGTPEDLITEIAKGMVTQAEISTRIGTARREGRLEERKLQEEQHQMERVNLIKKNLQKGKTPEDVADFLDIPLSQVLKIQQELESR